MHSFRLNVFGTLKEVAIAIKNVRPKENIEYTLGHQIWQKKHSLDYSITGAGCY